MQADSGPDPVRLRVRSVSAVPEPFLEPFLGILTDLTRFSLFRATGNLPKAPHVPSDGVREALGMHLGRPKPSAQTTGVLGGHMHFHFLTAFP